MVYPFKLFAPQPQYFLHPLYTLGLVGNIIIYGHQQYLLFLAEMETNEHILLGNLCAFWQLWPIFAFFTLNLAFFGAE